MDRELKDKVVLITGGAKGIGEAISRVACMEGAIPVILDRDASAAHELHLQLSPSGVVVTELSSAENCRNAVADNEQPSVGGHSCEHRVCKLEFTMAHLQGELDRSASPRPPGRPETLPF